MKKLIQLKFIMLVLIALLASFDTSAQNVNTVGIELGGNGGLYSVNFHKDFIRTSKKSFYAARVGVSAFPFVDVLRANLVFETTYTMFQHLEVGLGVSPFDIPLHNYEANDSNLEYDEKIRYPFLLRIGYRTDLGKKYLMKVAFTPAMSKNIRDNTKRFSPWFGVFVGRKL